jgi:hypothetical protein
MFESGITAESLVETLTEEIDVAPDISVGTYYNWLDEIEQLLYSEIIREIHIYTANNPANHIDFSDMTASGADIPMFEDVYAVHAGNKQLFKSTVVGSLFPDTYWKQENALHFNVTPAPQVMTVYYFIRPALKSTTPTNTIKLPIQFVPIIKAKLRGEAYKLVNEDNTAAKWLNDYNILLEQFKQYIADRQPQFGI